MNLLNIPKSYILTNEEICELDILINQALKEDRYRPYYYTALREIQRKLNLLDSVFRASEEPSWGGHAGEHAARWAAERKAAEQEAAALPGKPPYPTDEDGSFEVAKPYAVPRTRANGFI